jgi:hypothetical protein
VLQVLVHGEARCRACRIVTHSKSLAPTAPALVVVLDRTGVLFEEL